MKQKKKNAIKLLFAVFLMGLTSSKLQAQQAVIASGNNASGGGGTASYSVGQMIQVNNSSADGSAIQGIQFAFDGANLSIIDLQTNLEITTYPNPTTSVIHVNIDKVDQNTFDYQLFSISGQLVRRGKVQSKTTKIDVNNLETASYILKINNSSNQTTKSFKIIKN